MEGRRENGGGKKADRCLEEGVGAIKRAEQILAFCGARFS